MKLFIRNFEKDFEYERGIRFGLDGLENLKYC